MNSNNRIRIGRPEIKDCIGGARLTADVAFPDRDVDLWFLVDDEYKGFLTDDRADPWLVAVLPEALRNGYDIYCEAPVTRRLLYQIRRYLVPMLSGNISEFKDISVYADMADEPIPCKGAVGTGWTGGVDSMFTYWQSVNGECEPLTHLMVTSNGALEEPDNTRALYQMADGIKNGFAKEFGLPVIVINTNLQDVLDEPFLAVASFRHGAVALALQKLFRVFLFSAAYEFSRFSFDINNSFYYDLATLSALETDNLVFYAAGGAYSRVQKLELLADFKPAQKYLHPCIHVFGKNCGRCGKCVRTEAALHGLGKLDAFGKVFDTAYFYEHFDWYMAELVAHKNSQHYGEALMLLKQQGIEPNADALRMARNIRAAQAVSDRNRELLAGKFGLSGKI